MYISKTRLFILFALMGVLLAGGVFIRDRFWSFPRGAEVVSFEDCVAAGYLVVESYPRRCRTPDGRTFTEDKGDEFDMQNMMRVSNPKPNQEIISPLTITGEARGMWYFEATFPIVLVDWDGRIIAEGYAEAESEWMTENFVPFRATLAFDLPYTKDNPEFMGAGTLILRKSNPSGLPEHDNALEIPIRFKRAIKPISEETGRERDSCIISGCSGQLCGENGMVTTCEYRSEYACYQHAVCERQADGRCGWTLTTALGRCLMETGDTKDNLVSIRVIGRVSMGPTCPVAQNPPEEACNDKPYKTIVEIFSKDNTTFPLKTVETDANGSFSVDIPSGLYVFRPKGGEPFPICKEQEEVSIEMNKISEITLSCDTGIR